MTRSFTIKTRTDGLPLMAFPCFYIPDLLLSLLLRLFSGQWSIGFYRFYILPIIISIYMFGRMVVRKPG